MDRLVEAKVRLRAVLAEVRRVGESDFPYAAGRDALECIEKVFLGDAKNLEELIEGVSPTDTIQLACETAIHNIEVCLPLLGFVLRSTNVRNAFELHGPLTRLARCVLDPKIRLVLSSEWNYSPSIYIEPPSLDGFCMIGFPAHESGNPLIAPLAGHELGHAVWNHEKEELWRFGFGLQVEQRVLTELWSMRAQLRALDAAVPDSPTAKDFAGDLIACEKAIPAVNAAQRQAEEYFCDFVGLRLFGAAFLDAFSLLLAPRHSGYRIPEYPDLVKRAEAQVAAAHRFGIVTPKDYAERFQPIEQPAAPGSWDYLLLQAADKAASAVFQELTNHVDAIFAIERGSSAPVTKPGLPSQPELWTPIWGSVDATGNVIKNAELDSRIQEIAESFAELTPPRKGGSLALLLNGAWRRIDVAQQRAAEKNESLDIPAVLDSLREVVLKSVEVLEFEERLRDANIPDVD